ncbi:Vacuolar protein sorting-associated protein 52 A, partial [Zea mays]
MAVVPAAETLDGLKDRFDLGVFVGDLALDEEVTSDDESLEGLQQELDNCKNDQEVANILASGIKLREYTKGVENNIRQIELDSIQDYIKESENLVSLHDQICDCDNILLQMETVLTGFQTEIGSISSEIKVLQEKSMDMGLKLKNRKAAESKLSKFVEDIIVPPRMIDIIVDGEVNDEYMKTLET